MTAEQRANILAATLRRICTAGSLVPGDPLDDAYHKAGGGYGGLQQMAVTGLEMAEVDRIPPRPVVPEVQRDRR